MRMPSSTLWLAHEQPRQGQIEMIGDALESLQEGKIFLAAAPTGIGKTAAALASCIDFSSQDHFQSTIMFLTGKHSQHRIVIDTIRLINNRLPEDQRKILVVDLIGRDSMCKNLDRFQGICQCEGDGFSTPKNPYRHVPRSVEVVLNVRNVKNGFLEILKFLIFRFFRFTPLNFHHLIAETASPGPEVSVPTPGSWKYDDLL